MPRIFQPYPITENSVITLNDDAFNHLIRALRMQKGENITLFDGTNRVIKAEIIEITKKTVTVKTDVAVIDNRESSLAIHLGQVISRGEKMEFTIQKAVELGVNSITPLLSERCGVKLNHDRVEKKIEQWQKIVISACEQCGRNIIPQVYPAKKLEDWCHDLPAGLKLTLNPKAKHGIKGLTVKQEPIFLLIGPEGGLSDSEIALTHRYQFTDCLLGPRVLRTETAALTALTALQVQFGDLG